MNNNIYCEIKMKRLADKCLLKSKKERNRRNKMNRYIMELTEIIKETDHLVSVDLCYLFRFINILIK